MMFLVQFYQNTITELVFRGTGANANCSPELRPFAFIFVQFESSLSCLGLCFEVPLIGKKEAFPEKS